MNIYITSGTFPYLKKIEDKSPAETMVIMQNLDNAVLIHETNGPAFFKEPRSYEVIGSSGFFENAGFAVMNHIPVTNEGRPIFEYRMKNRAGQIEKQPGFTAMRVLRPLKSNTYIILTLWRNEKSFKAWKGSKDYAKEHEKQTEKVIDNQSKIFSSPSYSIQYFIPTEES